MRPPRPHLLLVAGTLAAVTAACGPSVADSAGLGSPSATATLPDPAGGGPPPARSPGRGEPAAVPSPRADPGPGPSDPPPTGHPPAATMLLPSAPGGPGPAPSGSARPGGPRVAPGPRSRSAAGRPAGPSRSPALVVDSASAYAGQLLDTVNAARRAQGLDPLARSGCLDSAAALWAVTMADRGSASHQSLAGAMSVCHVRRAGQQVAGTQSAAARLAGSWLSGSGRASLLDARATAVGIGVSRGPDGTWYACFDIVGS